MTPDLPTDVLSTPGVQDSPCGPVPSERLIPEPELKAAVTGDWVWCRTEAEVLDIAELRLLLGLPADTDLVSGDMLLRIVRRVVLLERRLEGS